MSKPIVFSVIESPSHPKLTSLIGGMGYQEIQFNSVRKAISGLRKQQPAVVIADFFYSYSNNYASNHISNLDSLLITLQKYSDYKPKFIFLAAKSELQYVDQLVTQYPGCCGENYALSMPVTDDQIRELL